MPYPFANSFRMLVLVLFLLQFSAAAALCENADLARLFSSRKVQGTLLIVNQSGTKRFVHDEARAMQRFLPASTFKIPNTLIALDEGLLTGQELFRWDGNDKGPAIWNRDQTLAAAFRNSCVWCYQELAQRIGTARYQTWLQKIGYGNALPLPELTTFWLSGDLRISAAEQVLFLRKLYRRELPFKAPSYALLRQVMLQEEKPGYRLYAKTGWAGMGQRDVRQTGWYVGYLETGDDVWFFALNLDINRPEEADYRQGIVMEALKLKNIVPSD